jgi:hypothetical protein
VPGSLIKLLAEPCLCGYAEEPELAIADCKAVIGVDIPTERSHLRQVFGSLPFLDVVRFAF